MKITDISRDKLDLRKRTGNRYTGAAGITTREAEALYSMIMRIEKIKQKPNLYFGTVTDLQSIQLKIWSTLGKAGRVKE